MVIPARFKSKRLPGKPLLDICGLPMIIRTYRQCAKVIPKSRILVATDDLRIKKVCKKENIKIVMTSKNCLTGTDRIAEVAKKYKAKFYLNDRGVIIMEIGFGQLDPVKKIFRKNGFITILEEKDLQGINRVVGFKFKK